MSSCLGEGGGGGGGGALGGLAMHLYSTYTT